MIGQFLNFGIYRDREPATSQGHTEVLDSLIQQFRVRLPVETEAPKLAYFDPNKITYDSLTLFGLDPFLAGNWIKYLQAGGRFYHKQDVKKIYGMNDSIWVVLAPWIHLAVGPKRSPPIRRSLGVGNVPDEDKTSTRQLDLNSADSTELLRVRGIGPVLSARIVKYRNLLGGFHSLEQLNEVYGLPEEAIDQLRLQAMGNELDPYHKIRLNSFNEREMARHPYLTFRQAQAITAYREQHGPFRNIEDMKSIHLIDDSTYRKIFKYLDF